MNLPEIDDFLTGRVKSLGWGVLDWCSRYLGQPDGKNKGDNWIFSPEQALFVLRYYAVDEKGRFRYTRAMLMRPKGWGKSPVLAAMCCAELLGPVRFSHFDEEGEPVGRREYTPLIQIAAISEDQANNTYYLVMEMLQEGEAYEEYDLDQCIMLSKVHTRSGGIIQKVTASPRGREGQRVTFVVCDETHLWVPAEKGPELFDAIRRNAVKMDNRIIETTNAPVPGESSVAETSFEAVKIELERGDSSILLDDRQVYVEDIYSKEQAMPALRFVYGDAAIDEEAGTGWVNLERVFSDIIDPSTKEHVARRFYFNQQIQGVSAWLKATEWRACRDESIRLRPKRDLFALGFKGQLRNGAAALVACRLTDFSLYLIDMWEKPEDGLPEWEVPFLKVDKVVRKTLSEDGCTKLLADPENWQEIIGRWSADHDDMIEELWLGKNKARHAAVVEQFETAVQSRRLRWKDEDISRHVLNCHLTEVPQGYTIRKEMAHSKRYITAAQAALLAFEAAKLAIEEGALSINDNTLYSF